jgi:hypothetical protein
MVDLSSFIIINKLLLSDLSDGCYVYESLLRKFLFWYQRCFMFLDYHDLATQIHVTFKSTLTPYLKCPFKERFIRGVSRTRPPLQYELSNRITHPDTRF